jgi:ComF family protein
LIPVAIPSSLQLKIYRALWKAVDFVYPPTCAGCGKPGTLWCDECQENTILISKPVCQKCGCPLSIPGICFECQTNPPPYTMLRSWAEYGDPVRKALISLKYKSNLGLGMVFSPMLVEMIKTMNWDFDCVIPVPISRGHQKERGYNQSTILARPISLAINTPLVLNSITRTKETQTQVELSREERFKNLESAFSINSAKLIGKKKVLLVDDITTTGATLISCSRALKEAGCSEIYCLTVARTKLNHQ